MTEPKRTRQLSGVSSLRAFELLVDHPTGLGITEMSRKLEMDGSQCHRLVNGLRSAGYVTKTNSTAPRYRVSPKVLRLAARLLVKSDVLRVRRRRRGRPGRSNPGS